MRKEATILKLTFVSAAVVALVVAATRVAAVPPPEEDIREAAAAVEDRERRAQSVRAESERRLAAIERARREDEGKEAAAKSSALIEFLLAQLKASEAELIEARAQIRDAKKEHRTDWNQLESRNNWLSFGTLSLIATTIAGLVTFFITVQRHNQDKRFKELQIQELNARLAGGPAVRSS